MKLRILLPTALRSFMIVCFGLQPLHGIAQSTPPVKNIILVHGAWADGSSWARVIPFLEERGFAEAVRVGDLRLNVSEADLSPFQPVAEQVSARGISITTFAEERERDRQLAAVGIRGDAV